MIITLFSIIWWITATMITTISTQIFWKKFNLAPFATLITLGKKKNTNRVFWIRPYLQWQTTVTRLIKIALWLKIKTLRLWSFLRFYSTMFRESFVWKLIKINFDIKIQPRNFEANFLSFSLALLVCAVLYNKPTRGILLLKSIAYI